MRRSSEQTKAVILAAAKERFAKSGFERATIRAIAADANIDPSMVMRYFGNKDQLFAAAADFDLQIPDLSDVARDQVGAALVDHFINRWERDEALIVLLRSSATNAEAAQRMRVIFASQLLPVIAKINPDRARTSRGPDRHADARAGAVPLCAAAAADRRHAARRDGGLAGADRSALPRGAVNAAVRPASTPGRSKLTATHVFCCAGIRSLK